MNAWLWILLAFVVLVILNALLSRKNKRGRGGDSWFPCCCFFDDD